MSEKLTRQQIYDRIRATSKDSYVLEEMKRLGFWDKSPEPSLPELLIKQEVEVNKELQGLLEKDRKYGKPEAVLAEMKKARMKKAKQKREETKQKNEQKRLEKAEDWHKLQQEQIVYLGEEISKGLSNTVGNPAQLQKYQLPVFNSVMELAQSMKIELSALRYLLYNRKVSKISHYSTFEIPKKSGGKRRISAPKSRLKQLQTWVLEHILNQIAVNDNVHGFIKEHSIVTNAKPHIAKKVLINVDLKDFFPSIEYKRVKGLFCAFGYSEQIAIILSLICTQAETDTIEMDGVTYYVQTGKRFLPQGSPASPAISNLIAYRLDKQLLFHANNYNFEYTRYADDLSFSSNTESKKDVAKMLYFIKRCINQEGFVVHPDKTQIMRKGALQKVTGVVVNEKLNIERSQLRKFRALLHNIETNGWKNQKWGKALHLINAIEGYICFVKMVNPQKASQFSNQLQSIIAKHGRPQIVPIHGKTQLPDKHDEPLIDTKNTERKDIDETKSKDTNWWNIF